MTGGALTRAIAHLQNPDPGGKAWAAREFGVDLTLLIEQLKLTPAERARRMHALILAAEGARGAAQKRRSTES